MKLIKNYEKKLIIRSKNFVLSLEKIINDRLPSERYSEYENSVFNIIRRWFSNTQSFTHQTSGSTGAPQQIHIDRNKIEISANATLACIDPHRNIKTSLLCLDPQHIGGAMVVYRSLIFGHDLTIVDPSSKPLKECNESFDLVSMVPMQFRQLSETEIDRFGIILIGGAPMDVVSHSNQTQIYSTFGMTETVSHIALRPIDKEVFTTTGDTEVSMDHTNLLKIKGTITDHKWLTTNDIVSVISKNSFTWIGRKDFIINSGGIKINPEAIERFLKDKIDGEIMISSLPDTQFDRKLILISDANEQKVDLSGLEKYHKPKMIYFNQVIIKTKNGKLDRKRTQEQFEKSF